MSWGRVGAGGGEGVVVGGEEGGERGRDGGRGAANRGRDRGRRAKRRGVRRGRVGGLRRIGELPEEGGGKFQGLSFKAQVFGGLGVWDYLF